MSFILFESTGDRVKHDGEGTKHYTVGSTLARWTETAPWSYHCPDKTSRFEELGLSASPGQTVPSPSLRSRLAFISLSDPTKSTALGVIRNQFTCY
jgi:hypothetical protein